MKLAGNQFLVRMIRDHGFARHLMVAQREPTEAERAEHAEPQAFGIVATLLDDAAFAHEESRVAPHESLPLDVALVERIQQQIKQANELFEVLKTDIANGKRASVREWLAAFDQHTERLDTLIGEASAEYSAERKPATPLRVVKGGAS